MIIGFRFSLLTLLLFSVLIGSVSVTILNLSPWQRTAILSLGNSASSFPTTLVFSRDSNKLLFGTWNGSSRYWDVENFREISEFSELDSTVRGVALAPDESYYISWTRSTAMSAVSGSGEAKWNLEMQCFADYSIENEVFVAYTVAEKLILFDARSGSQILEIATEKEVVSVRISPDGKQIFAIYLDGSLEIYDSASGEVQSRSVGHAVNGNPVLKFSTAGERFSIASDSCIRIYSKNSHVVEQIALVERELDCEWGMSPDGSKIILARRSGSIEIFDIKRTLVIGSVQARDFPIVKMAIADDGSRFCTIGKDGWVQMWALNSLDCLWEGKVLDGSVDNVPDIWLSPDGNRFVVSGKGSEVEVFSRVRNEHWWGILCLLNFWISFTLLVLVLWSIFRDSRLRKA